MFHVKHMQKEVKMAVKWLIRKNKIEAAGDKPCRFGKDRYEREIL